MATRNFVPRADGEGGIGTSAKQWAGGFFKKLAVVAITTAVTVLTPSADANNQQPATTSWVRTQFKSILEGVLSASGVKYNIAQNGYVCLGSFFGGLIIQWGIFGYIDSGSYITLPLSSLPFQVVANDMADHTNPLCLSTSDYVEGKFKVYGDRIKPIGSQLWGHWIAVCK